MAHPLYFEASPQASKQATSHESLRSGPDADTLPASESQIAASIGNGSSLPSKSPTSPSGSHSVSNGTSGPAAPAPSVCWLYYMGLYGVVLVEYNHWCYPEMLL